ncbi:MAG: aspartate aminotransferase family protein [Christensenellaceae bacterium]|nr:aspartate aminotransferase family protein [Christensenellaceae bacterium]
MDLLESIIKRDKEFLIGSYAPQNIAFVSGDGCKLFDTSGREYIDFLAAIAVNSLGHKHPVFINALMDQVNRIVASSNLYYNEYRGLLAERLTEGTTLKKVFFCNSGAEANECAIKLVRKYFFERGKNKFKFITAAHSFHGRTLTTVSATGQEKYSKPFAPLPPGFGSYIRYNDIEAMKKALEDDEVGALMLEPILGEGGVIPATSEYLRACREETSKRGILLILDEVQTGGGRTGTFWACIKHGIMPDILTAAKGIGGGLPIGACLTTEEVAQAFKPGDHGNTFGGSPLVCAVALAVVSKIRQPEFMQNIKTVGEYFKRELRGLASSHIVDVRGDGLMLGIELNPDLSAKTVVTSMLEKGFVINACGDNVLRFLPPLIIEKCHIDAMLNALKTLI